MPGAGCAFGPIGDATRRATAIRPGASLAPSRSRLGMPCGRSRRAGGEELRRDPAVDPIGRVADVPPRPTVGRAVRPD